MFVLPILPDEIPETLTDGVTAFLRPLDHGELAALLDTWPVGDGGELPIQASPWIVRRQLLRIEGLSMGAEGVAFDPATSAHLAALPWAWVQTCAAALYRRMNLSESSAKNSVAPSVSAAPIDGAA
jgi:hypothetical protein